MYRGSSPLLQHSARYLVPLIQIIAKTDISFWEIDAHCYTEANIERIFDFANEAWSVYPNMSEILITKVMLGVFGNVPAFDMYFMQGCKAVGISSTFKPTERKPTALPDLAAFYEQNAAEIDAQRIATMDFLTGSPTQRKYTRAKVIDMAFFTEGGG